VVPAVDEGQGKLRDDEEHGWMLVWFTDPPGGWACGHGKSEKSYGYASRGKGLSATEGKSMRDGGGVRRELWVRCNYPKDSGRNLNLHRELNSPSERLIKEEEAKRNAKEEEKSGGGEGRGVVVKYLGIVLTVELRVRGCAKKAPQRIERRGKGV